MSYLNHFDSVISLLQHILTVQQLNDFALVGAHQHDIIK